MDIEPFAEPRRQYEEGVSLRVLKRRFNMTDGELRDMAPEEFADEHVYPENGY